jgi:D-alanyl-D-alanine endopeptidase (penicillin-binding protein 7)
VRRATILLPAALAITFCLPAGEQDALAAGRRARARPVARKQVFLERRVPAFRNNLPNVQARGALVVDLDTGQEIFSRNADQPRAIASISKLAAALVVMDHHLVLDELTTLRKVDIDVARGGATSRLHEGMTLSNRDLLHAALLGSDNRAVSALGRAVGLTAGQLAEAMTRKVAQLGLPHTRFRDPTGLSPENVSTPREIVALLRAAMSEPTLGTILRRLEYDAHPLGRAPIKYVNTHRPAHRSNTDVLGGKTGYTDAARYCLVLAARVDTHAYGMAFLGTEGKLTRFGDVARVADWLVLHRPRAPAEPQTAPSFPVAAPVEITSSSPSPDAGAPAMPTASPSASTSASAGDKI